MFKKISSKWIKVLHPWYIALCATFIQDSRSHGQVWRVNYINAEKIVFLHLRLNCAIRDEQHHKSLSSAIDKDECVKLELYSVEDEDMDDDVDIATLIY